MFVSTNGIKTIFSDFFSSGKLIFFKLDFSRFFQSIFLSNFWGRYLKVKKRIKNMP